MDSNLLTQLLQVSQRMAETRDLDPLLKFAMGMALELFNAERGYLVLLNEDDTLHFHVKIDRDGKEIQQPEAQISKTFLYNVIAKSKGDITHNAMSEHPSKSSFDLQLRSVMCAPLISRNQAIGALYLENRSQTAIFKNEDLEALQFFANQAAVSIENAMLNAELESLSRHRSEELRLISETLHDQAIKSGTLDKRVLSEALERERMRVIANFIQDASHHFRTPLAIINTNVDLVKRKMGENTYERYFNTIHSQVNVIVELVDTLNYMVTLDSVTIDKMNKVDLNSVAREMYDVKSPNAKGKSVEMILQEADKPVEAMGKLEYIRQALGRILDNAIAFTPEQGTVKIRVYSEDKYQIIEVDDNGVGIDKEDLPHIFERFFRKDKAGTTRGFGLGLSIAQRIMELHNGAIDYQSEPDKGSIFRMKFPKGE